MIPPIRPVEAMPPRVPYAAQQVEVLMPDSTNSLLTLSTAVADVVERTAKAVVAVAHGGRGTISGIHWRSGVIVTAEEMLEQDKDITVTLPGGLHRLTSRCCASLRTDWRLPRRRMPARCASAISSSPSVTTAARRSRH